jgi:hypothetical protein
MQVPLDFAGKRDRKITSAICDELDDILDKLAQATGKPKATICEEYISECASRDFGKLLILKQRGTILFDMDKL